MKKILSLVLSLVMVLALSVSALADSNHVNVTYADGKQVALANTNPILIHTVGEQAVDKINVTDSKTTTSLEYSKLPYTGKLANGTGYQVYVSTAADGTREVFFKYTTELRDTVDVVVIGKAATFTVNANSGVYGQGLNRGGNATCSLSDNDVATMGEETGYSYTMTFKPLAGQEIVKLNLRANYTDDKSAKLVDAVTANVAVDGQKLNIVRNADGSVTVSAARVIRNLFITALTRDEVQQEQLTVITDTHSTSDFDAKLLDKGTSTKVALTPEKGYGIGDIVITSNGASGVIHPTDKEVVVDGKTYTVTRSLDGKVVLDVPAMTANVTVEAVATSTYHFVTVTEGLLTRSAQSGTHYLADGSSLEIRFRANTDAAIEGVFVKTEKGVYYAKLGDDRIFVDNTSYRLSAVNDSEITMFVAATTMNMEVYPETRVTTHSFTASADKGATCSISKTVHVGDGDTFSVSFTPLKGLAVKTLTVRYGNETKTVEVKQDTVVRIDGRNHMISVGKDGEVAITMNDIREDVSVKAATDYPTDASYRITRNSDAHSTIELSDSATVAYGKEVTVTVTPGKGYSVDTVEFSTKTDSAVVSYRTNSFELDGVTYQVTRKSDGRVIVVFDTLRKDLAIKSVSVFGEAGDRHNAYMTGYGNGMFGPDTNMTRAEAVMMLSNIYGLDSKMNTRSAYYTDVTSGAWYYMAIQNAAARGYLNVITGNDKNFYPNQNITRAELLALLFQFSGTKASNGYETPSFADMLSGHWAVGYVNTARRLGWVNGFGDNTFHPDQNVTRAEVVTMVNHVLGRYADRTRSYSVNFSDVGTNHWAYYDIMEATNSHTAMKTGAHGETWVR